MVLVLANGFFVAAEFALVKDRGSVSLAVQIINTISNGKLRAVGKAAMPMP
jgi:CBS domain containing-hemolysin-like protein